MITNVSIEIRHALTGATLLTFDGAPNASVSGVAGVTGTYQKPDISTWHADNYLCDPLWVIAQTTDDQCGPTEPAGFYYGYHDDVQLTSHNVPLKNNDGSCVTN